MVVRVKGLEPPRDYAHQVLNQKRAVGRSCAVRWCVRCADGSGVCRAGWVLSGEGGVG